MFLPSHGSRDCVRRRRPGRPCPARWPATTSGITLTPKPDGLVHIRGLVSWVGPITGSTARRVGCDADVTYVAVDAEGSARVVGREKRFFTWAQRKAMIARDGDRCAVPFCDRPIAWADAHHLTDWTLGGPTTTTNGALPCAAHHTLCHEGGWTLIRQPDGRYLFRHRNGKNHRTRTTPTRTQPTTPTPTNLTPRSTHSASRPRAGYRLLSSRLDTCSAS